MRVTGHFGEWMQGRLGPEGPVVLVTLPCPVLAADMAVTPGDFAVHDVTGVLDEVRARAMLAALNLPATGRHVLRLGMPAGGGAGASTAALMALARAAGAADPGRITAAALAVEGATDPLLFAHPERLLWASRQGRILADLPALPQAEILGGFLGPGQRTDPTDSHFPDISDLVSAWERADGLPAFAHLASESARRTLALRGPAGDPTEALARAHGALGHLIAHTGSARGLVFAPGTVPEGAEADLRAAGFSRITRFVTGG